MSPGKPCSIRQLTSGRQSGVFTIPIETSSRGSRFQTAEGRPFKILYFEMIHLDNTSKHNLQDNMEDLTQPQGLREKD